MPVGAGRNVEYAGRYGVLTLSGHLAYIDIERPVFQQPELEYLVTEAGVNADLSAGTQCMPTSANGSSAFSIGEVAGHRVCLLSSEIAKDPGSCLRR